MVLRYCTKGDIVLIVVLFVLSAGSTAGVRTLFSGGKHVVVEVDGRHEMELSLDRDVTETVRGPIGETVVTVEHGKVRIVKSDCPHKYCIRMGAISRSGEVIVCVPNHVVVKVTGGGKDEFDGIAQ